MSGKLNMKSIIAIAAVTILTAIAITGTVVFLKDKGTSEATEIASENGVNGSGTETINVQENGVKEEKQEQNGRKKEYMKVFYLSGSLLHSRATGGAYSLILLQNRDKERT